MASAFPGPVLAVAPDVVRHLKGEETLPILWTLFTKCKESLKDGHRLENISWRLWHKSMAETALTACGVDDASVTKTLAADDVLLSEKAYCPPTPEEIPQPPPITFDTMSNVPLSAQGMTHSPNSLDSSQLLDQQRQPPSTPFSLHALPISPSLSRKSPSSSPSTSTASRRNSMKKVTVPVSVGKILCELLPTATVSSLSSLVPNNSNTVSTLPLRSLVPPTQQGDPHVSPSISLPLSTKLSHLATDLPTMSTTTTMERCSAPPPPTVLLPTPEAERDCLLLPTPSTHSSSSSSSSADRHPPIVPVIATHDSSPLPTNMTQQLQLQQPLIPDHHQHHHPDPPSVPPLPPPPRLVVVNPTPNPTPHPTPPATPVLHPPIAGYMKQEGAVAVVPGPSGSSGPLPAPAPSPSVLLRVPGQDALVQAQARARSHQMSSKLRLMIHDSTTLDDEAILDSGLGGSESGVRSKVPETSSTPTTATKAVPPPPPSDNTENAPERMVTSKRHSISSDITATSSSPSSPSSPSTCSKTTSATTISEPFRFMDLQKVQDASSPTSDHQDRASAGGGGGGGVNLETDLSPMSATPAATPFGPESVSTQASLSSSSKRRGEGGRVKSGSPLEKGDEGGRSVGPATLGRSTSNHRGPSLGGGQHYHHSATTRKTSHANSRSRLVRQGSTTSAKSRSDSRTRENSGGGGVNAPALVMTRVAGAVAAAAAGTGAGGGGVVSSGKAPRRGRTVGGGMTRNATRTKVPPPKRQQSLNLTEALKPSAEELKRAIMFNIGSGSEEGGSHAGSKSTGSGSENYVKEGNGVLQQQTNRAATRQQVEEGGAGGGVGGGSLKKGKDVLVVTPIIAKEIVSSPGQSQVEGEEESGEVVMLADQEKGKGKGKDKVGSASAVPLRVEATIADPLLPGSARRQIVITSDSEDFETETESFSGDESADAPLSASQQQLQLQLELMQQQQKQQQKQQQQQQQLLQQQQQQQQARPHPPPLLRTQSHNIPRNQKPLNRAQQRQAEQRAVENEKWEREMFVKLPKSSFQDLAQVARTNSTGLLSILLNPDPQRLPVDHPYRRGFSSGMIQPLRPFTAITPITPAKQPPPQQPQPQPQPHPVPGPSQLPAQPPPSQATDPQRNPNVQAPRHSRQPSRNHKLPKYIANLANPSVGATAKTPVAPAKMSELLVGSVSTKRVTTSVGVSVNGSASKYKPKPRPAGMVMEDTSDGESDDENQMDLSKSVAQEKLKVLLEGKKMKKPAQVPEPVKEDQLESVVPQDAPREPAEAISIPPPRLLYPYNLPPPNPPTTPRTTRRVMLAVEIPESLRRNLLWERQVSQAHQKVPKRSTSSGDVVKGFYVPSVVKLTPKGAQPEEPKVTKEEKRARFLARTRSWAYEYHVSGW